VLTPEDVVLEADDGQNQEEGPSSGIEKAIKFHPESPFEFKHVALQPSFPS
jgi:hypothetical protein